MWPGSGEPRNAATLFGKALVGKTLPEAETEACHSQFQIRVLHVNGKGRPYTMDLCKTRINLAVKNGKVTEFLGAF